MAQYYYLVSTLPMLWFDSEKYLSEGDFLEACAARVSQHDYRRLINTELRIDPVAYQPLTHVQSWWYRREVALRNAVARVRAAALNRDPEESIRLTPDGRDLGDDLEVIATVREAYSQESPLRREERLLQYRWQLLEEVSVDHFFDLDTLVVYFLKLKILYRRSYFQKDLGNETFDQTYKSVQDNYYGASA
ncbi:MAG: DUF2764 family protein [Spirochaetota bacterium]